MTRRRVLIVAPHFAPINAPDGHRARIILPWLAESGWDPTVLAVRPERATAPTEPELTDTLPSDVRVHRVNALALATSRRFGLGNLGWRCLPWLWREGSRLLKAGDYNLVYFSTTQFACLPLGRWWRRRFGMPYVIDLQDPWHNTYYAGPGAPGPPGGWKYRFAALTTSAMESWTLRRCSHVITVSRQYIDDLKQRRPWFDATRTTVLPFGWSERDQLAAAAQSVPSSDPVTILYCGRVGDDMARLLRLLLAAFAEWRRRHPPSVHVHWDFVGTSYAENPRAGGVPTRLARELGISDLVFETPLRIGYLEAMARQQRSPANLILGSDDRAYSPSKIWSTLATGRPWLACVPADGTLADLLRPHDGAGLVLAVAGAGLTSDQTLRLARFFDELAGNQLVTAIPSPTLREFHADRMARKHAEIFDRIVTT